jgi:hypothetical protein
MPMSAARKRQGYPGGDTQFVDAVFIGIRGKQRYLCRSID